MMRACTFLLCFAALALPADAQPACLDMATATGTSFTRDGAMLVRTKSREVYRVTFRHGCAAATFPRTYFVYEPWTLRPCLHSGHTLPTNDKGPCIVDTVTRVSAAQ